MKNLEVALIGYGKMGKMIEEVCLERGHHIKCTIDSDEDWKQKTHLVETADVAIDFSLPQTAVAHIQTLLGRNIPLVIGTTGWYAQLAEITALCHQKNAALFYAPNFSLGMNMVFQLNKQLAHLINATGYHLSIKETHHIHKLDAPSGTALQLANDIIENNKAYSRWAITDMPDSEVLPIEVHREGEVNGIHEIIASSPEDSISLRHEAFSRRGFALGAVVAAEFLVGKKGIFNMNDLLQV